MSFLRIGNRFHTTSSFQAIHFRLHRTCPNSISHRFRSPIVSFTFPLNYQRVASNRPMATTLFTRRLIPANVVIPIATRVNSGRTSKDSLVERVDRSPQALNRVIGLVRVDLFYFMTRQLRPFLTFRTGSFSSINQRIVLRATHRPSFIFPLRRVARPYLTNRLRGLRERPRKTSQVQKVVRDRNARLTAFLFSVFRRRVTTSFVLRSMYLRPRQVLIRNGRFLITRRFRQFLQGPNRIASSRRQQARSAPRTRVHLFLFQLRTTSSLRRIRVIMVPTSHVDQRVRIRISATFRNYPIQDSIEASSPKANRVPCPNPQVDPTTSVRKSVPKASFPSHPCSLHVTLLFIRFRLLTNPTVICLSRIRSPFVRGRIYVLTFGTMRPCPSTVLINVPSQSTNVNPNLQVSSNLRSR